MRFHLEHRAKDLRGWAQGTEDILANLQIMSVHSLTVDYSLANLLLSGRSERRRLSCCIGYFHNWNSLVCLFHKFLLRKQRINLADWHLTSLNLDLLMEMHLFGKFSGSL